MLERINLVPQRPLAERIRKKMIPILGVMICIIIIAVGLEYMSLDKQRKKTGQDLDAAKARKALADELQNRTGVLKAEVEANKGLLKELQTKVDGQSEIRGQKRCFSGMLSGIAGIIPATVKCDKISFQDNTGTISGSAVRHKDLPGFIMELGKVPEFKRAMLQAVDRNATNTNGRLSFTIMLELN